MTYRSDLPADLPETWTGQTYPTRGYEVVANVNGFEIERQRIGAAVYWNAYRLDDEGYVCASYRNCGSKAAAIAKAESHPDQVS